MTVQSIVSLMMRSVGVFLVCVTVGIRPGIAAADLATTSRFDIPPQQLPSALLKYSEQSGVQVTSPGKLVEGRNSPGVVGTLDGKQALQRLLQGTALSYDVIDSNTVLIRSSGSDLGPTAGGGQSGEPASAKEGKASSSEGFRVAQATVGDGQGGAPVLQEIVVTATKREERLQDVPMSLSALSGEDLARSQSYRLEDYVGQVPGLNIVNVGAEGSQLVIRGMTTGSAPVNSSVATYIDETPYTVNGSAAASFAVAPNLDPFDMQRIEVLRGPQGTLYGANALGGLLKYVTNAPDPAGFAASAAAGINSVSHGGTGYDLHAMVNLPLASTMALRLVGYDDVYPGFIDDPSRGLKDVDGTRFKGGRVSVLFQPSAFFSLRLNALYQERSYDDAPTEDVEPNTLQPIYGSLSQEHFIGQPGFIKVQLYNLTANWSLGFAQLVSTSSYFENQLRNNRDYSGYFGGYYGLLFPGASYGAVIDLDLTARAFTQEVRLSSSNDGPWQWLVGGFFTNENSPSLTDIYAVDAATRNVLVNFHPSASTIAPHYREYAGFANLGYHITPTVDVGAGARYSANSQFFHDVGSGLFYGGIDFSRSSSEHVVTYSADASWHVTPETMLYARVADGFVPGGPNTQTPNRAAPQDYASSTATSYEVGFKGGFLERRVTMELSSFLIDWHKIQLIDFSKGFGTTTNGGTARSSGVEWNVGYTPIRGLTLDFNGANTFARLTQPALGAPAGDRLPSVPRWQTSATARYERPLVGQYSAFVGLDWRYTGSRLGDFESVGSRQRLPSFDIFDVRAGVEAQKWSFSLYVKNLANKTAINYLVNATALGGLGLQSAVIYPPRTVGATVAVKF